MTYLVTIAGLLRAAAPPVRRGVPLLVELAGVALIAAAASYLHIGAALLVVGVFLLYAGNQPEG